MKIGLGRLTVREVQLSDIIRQPINGMAPVAQSAGIRLFQESTDAEIVVTPQTQDTGEIGCPVPTASPRQASSTMHADNSIAETVTA